MGQIAFKFFAGAVAGLLAWVVVEPTKPANFMDEALWGRFETSLTLMLGLLIGLTIGAINGWLQGSRTHFIRGLVLGAIFGALGATLGSGIGGAMSVAVKGPEVLNVPMPVQMAARILFGSALGAGIGLGIGASGLTLRRTIQGFIGGLLGGLIGGALFDPVTAVLQPIATTGVTGVAEIGGPGRIALCLLIGAFVGLLIGAVEAVGKTAWIRHRVGRNEGRDWVIDVSPAHIGRDERANIPLFGDQAVAPLHCSIVRQGDAYWLYDAGTPNGTLLNGQRVTKAPLYSGALIQVGSFVLEFMLRPGSAPARASEQLRGIPIAVAPTQPGQYARMVQPMPAPTAPATPSLVFATGPLAGQRFPLTSALEIGREGAHVQLPDAQASRKHARISMAPSGPMIEDLGSTNGTFVNGQRISTTVLRPADVVRIGQSEFRVEL